MEKMDNLNVAVIGLGYVGLTLATVLADLGINVTGIEIRSDIVEKTNHGVPHFSENGLKKILLDVVSKGKLRAANKFSKNEKYQVFIITVGTPLDKEGNTRIDIIENATREVASQLEDGGLVILRSTVKVGTSRNIVAPILKKTGKKFLLAMCPERTLEGKALTELRILPQIIGSDDVNARDSASKFFGRITKSIINVSNFEAAEIIKLVDNTYRDVHFAFANEVASICELFNVSAHEVISSGKLGYSRTNVPLPGLVGGPCLEKDPHILRESVESVGGKLNITPAARFVNEDQPKSTVKTIGELGKFHQLPVNSKLCILGMAFKGVPETDDLRGSMSIRVLHEIKDKFPEWDIVIFDPVIHPNELKKNFPEIKVAKNIHEAVSDKNIVIFCNNHEDFDNLRLDSLYKLMSPNSFIYDYWNKFSNLSDIEHNGKYYAVGQITTGKKDA